jgi:hypothetical protein
VGSPGDFVTVQLKKGADIYGETAYARGRKKSHPNPFKAKAG